MQKKSFAIPVASSEREIGGCRGQDRDLFHKLDEPAAAEDYMGLAPKDGRNFRPKAVKLFAIG